MTEVTPDSNSPQRLVPGPETLLLGMGDQAHFQRYQQTGNKVLWGIFALLLVLVAGVFFVLPTYVAAPDLSVAVVVVPTATEAAPALSPFEEAQRLRLRVAAQNTLAVLLELQEELDSKQVQNWAAEAFSAALDQAHLGDAAYRTQQFIAANDFYQAGVAALQAIKEGEDAMYAAFLDDGNSALAAGEANASEQAFGQALLIKPDSSEAVAGLERANVLNAVLDLLESGRNLHTDNQFEAARELYRQALALDGAHPDVSAALQQLNTDLAERNFAAAMSRGYVALQDGDADAALRAFEQALSLRPGSAEVEAAMQQARDRQTFAAISVHIEAAQQREASEAWAQALAAWDEALAIDPNLVVAVQGRERSESRRNLDDFLQNTLANPLRLADANVSAQTRQMLAAAARLSVAAGPRLNSQIQQINGLLERARVPVTVQLQSDGMTTVTVYRVGELGLFTEQTLSLLPGEYTAVGVRAGYRDVRQDFIISLDGQTPVITVACTEAI